MNSLDLNGPHRMRPLASIARYGHSIACSVDGLPLLALHDFVSASSAAAVARGPPSDPSPQRCETIGRRWPRGAVARGVTLHHALGVCLQRGGQVSVPGIQATLRAARADLLLSTTGVGTSCGSCSPARPRHGLVPSNWCSAASPSPRGLSRVDGGVRSATVPRRSTAPSNSPLARRVCSLQVRTDARSSSARGAAACPG
jgi:hypothetical protein